MHLRSFLTRSGSGRAPARPRTGWRTTPWVALAIAGALLLAGGPTPVLAQSGGAGDLQSGFDAPLPGAAPSAGDSFQGGFDAPLPGGAPAGDAGAAGGSAVPEPPPEEPSWWQLSGFLRVDAAYSYAHDPPDPPGPPPADPVDHRGLSKLRTTLHLQVDFDLGKTWKALVSGQAARDWAYQLRDIDYPDPVLERYQQEAELQEAWVLATPLPSLDVKVGRQIVVWGKSDSIRIVDVLNPIDLREPGLTDLEDLRLPLAMTKVSWYVGQWSLTGIAIHEARYNKEPASGSDYYPAGAPVLPEVKPAHGGADTEWAASLSGVFTGWDLAFYAADVFNDEAHVVDPMGTPTRQHARLRMVGVAANVALGNTLLKTEWARFDGLRYTNAPGQDFQRLDGMVGVEYTGFTDTTLALEAADRIVLDYDAALATPPYSVVEEINQYVLSYRGSYLREKLDVVAVLIAYGAKANQGTVQRYQLTYEIARATDLTGGVLIYTAGDGGNPLLLQGQDNDRIFAALKWSF